MTALTLDQAVANVYASLHNNNDEIDAHIAALKGALAAAGEKVAVFDPAKLAQSNRQGRKLMESYFKKRGVEISFKAS